MKCKLPAEFSRHKKTYVLWPTREDNWREKATHAQLSMAAFVNAIAQSDEVTVGYLPGSDPFLNHSFAPTVSFREMNYNDIWVRDTGPFIINCDGGRQKAIHFRFNSWGGLFNDYSADNTVARQIATSEAIELAESHITLEGGAILTDGNGTLFVTEESMLAENRNPEIHKKELGALLSQTLCAQQIVWVPLGLANDEAGGHIDNVISVVDSSTILIAVTDDKRHPSYGRLKAAGECIRSARNLDGSPYKIHPVPLPPMTVISSFEAAGFGSSGGSIIRKAGTPLAPSYLNLYIGNKSVFVPTFDALTDDTALEIIHSVFAGRHVVGIPSREFVLGGGGLHCITKEIPVP
jgi:agmatine deiminase